jgi:hypothetical protein
MYSEKELKLYALEAIKESKIPNDQKLELVNQLKECNLFETMAFLNKGQMLAVKLEEDQLIECRDSFYENENLQDSIMTFLNEDITGGAVLATTIIGGALIYFRNYLTKARRACRDFMGVERRTCLYRYKVDAYKAAIAKAASSAGKCKSDKNPEKCQAKIANFIAKTKEKLATQQRSLAAVQGTKTEKEREAREAATTKQIAKRRNLVNVNVNKK